MQGSFFHTARWLAAFACLLAFGFVSAPADADPSSQPPVELVQMSGGDDPDFDLMSEKAYGGSGTRADGLALWAAAFSLKSWYFIGRGKFPDVHPYMASNPTIIDGATAVKAFTDADKLRAFARENGLLDEKGVVVILEFSIEDVERKLAAYEGDAPFLHFNADSGSKGFYSPIANLGRLRAALVKEGYLAAQ